MRGTGARRAAALAIVVALAAVAATGSSASSRAGAVSIYTGYGFDACSAPSLNALQAWQASPYRAVGVYLGGVNRACGDGNLSPAWIGSVQAMGWSLMPLYVGLQAPCVTQKGLAKIAPATADAQGRAAADDAAARALAFGLPAGTPITFDMEGYSTTNPACTKTVQTFLAAWDDELRGHGFMPSVYGSAASTIRDVAPLAPDQVWIADWNGKASVFGDPYVSDALWPSHQRIHQYKGGHRETWGGVTIDVDSDYVDASVVSPFVAAPPPPPTPPAGSVGSGDGQATASWQAGTFAATAVVTLQPTTVTTPPAGYAATGGYAVTLAATDASATPPTPIASFAKPVDVHFVNRSVPLVPLISRDGGATWQVLPKIAPGTLPPGVRAGFVANADGTIDVLTLDAGIVALLPDQAPPSQPALSGRFVHGTLLLSWTAATDNSGRLGSYTVLLDGGAVLTVPASQRHAAVHAFHPDRQTVYRVQATDATGNVGKPSQPLVVLPAPKPTDLPRPVPQWAWKLFAWQRTHAGPRPTAPKPLPGWYWDWAAWRLAPFRLR